MDRGLKEHLAVCLGKKWDDASVKLGRCGAVSGGCINQAWQVETSAQPVFVKTHAGERAEVMFAAEAEGLMEIRKSESVLAPEPYIWGRLDGGPAYLVMEYIQFAGESRNAMSVLGRQLAGMHRYHNTRYGWHRDNTIGSTPQPNTWCDQWISFLQQHRLGFQFELARENGGGRVYDCGQDLLDNLSAFFAGYSPQPALLHGDLWSGNQAVSVTGEPVIFDPAVYFGDREADIAMTRLFGGFSPSFYDAYQSEWPLDQGYSVRETLYNLYHILNHFNLFGGGYLAQAERMCESLLSEVR